MSWIQIIGDLNSEEIVKTFDEQELQKANEIEFRIGKVIKKRSDKLYVKWKGFGNLFNSWIDKKDIVYKENQYVSKLCEHFGGDVKVELDLSNYVTKADLKVATGVDTSNLAAKSDLASLRIY